MTAVWGGSVQCGRCGSIGTHLSGCEKAPSGVGIGQRRRRADGFDLMRWAANKARLWDRDRSCRFPNCFVSGRLHPHHVETVQEVFGRGGGWGEADRLENLVALCLQHHDWVHAGVNIDDAREMGLRV